MIDFELNDQEKMLRKMLHGVSEGMLRPLSRHYDSYEHEHDEKKELEPIVSMLGLKPSGNGRDRSGDGGPRRTAIGQVVAIEELCWGDVGLMLALPGRGLGNAAIGAVGTPEQKERFAHMYAAMAITEPQCGSDTAAITTTAELDPVTNEWIINGEKIFITGGKQCEAVVVWATLDKDVGRAAIKSFVIEKTRPGCTLVKLEHKLGIRASDTAAIKFEDCRIPYENILGTPEIKPKAGFAGVMKTFDNTRPTVAAQAIGVARAALEFTKAKLEDEGFTFPYDRSPHELSCVQRDVMDMEANLEVSRLLNWRAACMIDEGVRNSLEASMAKAKAGRAATLITQKCVELLGPTGYSREWLVEKWMRDCKITDLFEGTGQIQMLIIARLILGYSRDELK